jgi:hypothetical protein
MRPMHREDISRVLELNSILVAENGKMVTAIKQKAPLEELQAIRRRMQAIRVQIEEIRNKYGNM